MKHINILRVISLWLYSLAIIGLSFGQGNSFLKYYGASFPNSGNYSYSLIETLDKGYAFTGTTLYQTAPTTFESQMMLYRTTESGVLLWAKSIPIVSFGGIADCADAAGHDIVQLEDSGYIIAGVCGYDLACVRVNKFGDTLWTKYTSYRVGVDVDISATDDGDYVISGSGSNSIGGPIGARLIKIDTNGNVLWSKVYDYLGNSVANEIARSYDGGYFIGATAEQNILGVGATHNYYIIKTNSVGDTVWTRQWVDSSADVWLRTIIATSDRGLLAGGGNSAEGVLVKFDSLGTFQWVLDRPNNICFGLYEDVGNAWYSLISRNYSIGLEKIAYDGSTFIWSNTYTNFSPAYSSSFVCNWQHDFVLNGYGSDSLNSMAILIKTDSSGSILSEETSISNLRVDTPPTFTIYPNPSRDKINLSFQQAITGIVQIFSSFGTSVFSDTLANTNVKELDIKMLQSGIYYIRVIDKDGIVNSKFLKF